MYPARMVAFAAGCLICAGPALVQGEEPQSPKKAAQPNRTLVVDAFMKMYDKNGDGFIERNEMPAELKSQFDQWDVQKNGKLSREELLKHTDVLRRYEHRDAKPEFREQKREVRAERRGKRRNNGQNAGVLLQPEVLGVLVRLATSDEPGRTGAQMVYEVLQGMDTNHDGNIDHAEWQAMLDRVHEFRVNNIMRRQGEDGKISRGNARGVVRWNFDEWDTNKDGFIDVSELRLGFHLKAKPIQEKVMTEPEEE